jgi:ribosomal protein L7/L12
MNLFRITEEIAQVFKEHYINTPESLQEVLIILRKMGMSQIESIKIIMHELDLKLQEANELVSSSKAWNSRLDEL